MTRTVVLLWALRSSLLSCLAGAEADTLLRDKNVSASIATNASIAPAGRVALLLRGETFRGGFRFAEGCQNESVDAQLRSTTSLVRHIIEPLEGLGMRVEIFAIFPACSLNGQLRGILRESRIVTALTRRTESQAVNIRAVLDAFRHKAGNVENYDLVIVTRHDMRWHKSILRWPTANFTGFNFFSACEKTPYPCVHDTLHMMPGSMFDLFVRAVGKHHCFHTDAGDSHGHGCMKHISPPLMAWQVHFATDWVFSKNCRDHTDIGGIQFHGSPEDAPPPEDELNELDES